MDLNLAHWILNGVNLALLVRLTFLAGKYVERQRSHHVRIKALEDAREIRLLGGGK